MPPARSSQRASSKPAAWKRSAPAAAGTPAPTPASTSRRRRRAKSTARCAAQPREVKQVKRPQRPQPRHSELEHRELPAGRRHTRELTDRRVEIDDVAQAERDRGRAEPGSGEGKRECVSHQRRWRRRGRNSRIAVVGGNRRSVHGARPRFANFLRASTTIGRQKSAAITRAPRRRSANAWSPVPQQRSSAGVAPRSIARAAFRRHTWSNDADSR